MKTEFIASWKFPALLLVLFIIFGVGTLFLTNKVVDEIQTVGLKSIVESVWYGKAQNK